jgi:hypothetical protein
VSRFLTLLSLFSTSKALLIFPTVQLLFRQQAITAAIETNPIVTTERPPALCALPLCLLTLNKSGKRMPLDKGQIFDPTHVVIFLIPRVKTFQVPAWEVLTFVTKPNFMIQKGITSSLYKRAFLISRAASSTIRHTNPFAFYIVFARKVPTAHRAIHAARSDEFGFFSLKHTLSKEIQSTCSYIDTFHLTP